MSRSLALENNIVHNKTCLPSRVCLALTGLFPFLLALLGDFRNILSNKYEDHEQDNHHGADCYDCFHHSYFLHRLSCAPTPT